MITSLEAAQEELTAGEDAFRAAFVHAAVGMALATPDGRLAHVNPAFCAFMGYDESELIGLNLLVFTHPEDRSDSSVQLRRLMAGEAASVGRMPRKAR